MNVVPSELKELAQYLLVREARNTTTENVNIETAIEVCQRLRQPLATFAGEEGFRSLLARALALSKAQDTSLSALNVHADGTIQVGNANAWPDQSAARDAGIALVGQLLALLTTFIGPSLTMNLVHRVWPDLDLQTGGRKNP